MHSSSKATTFGILLLLTLAFLSSISYASTACLNLTANYTMDASLFVKDTCFNISNDNITLDCAGFSLIGAGSGLGGNTAVFNSKYDNVTVQNCIISNFSTGIVFSTFSVNDSIYNTTMSNISGFGIFLNNSNWTTIISTNISSIGNAIFGNSSSNGTFYNITATASWDEGVLLSGGGSNLMINSSFITTYPGNGNSALYISAGTSSTVINCTCTSAYGVGLMAQSGISDYFYNVTVITGTADAFYLTDSSISIVNSTGISSSGRAFYIGGSNTNIINSTGISNSSSAFYLITTGTNITNSTGISTTGTGLNITWNSKNDLIVNSSFYSASGPDISSTNYSATSLAGNNIILNSTFNRSEIMFTGNGTNLTIMWYAQVTVTNQSGVVEPNIGVVGFDSSGQIDAVAVTDSNGLVMMPLTELWANGTFVYNGSNQQNVTFYSWPTANSTIAAYGLQQNYTNMTMNESRSQTFTIPEAGSTCDTITQNKTLTNSIATTGSACFTIANNNVTLDCAGYQLISNGTGAGVVASKQGNASVKNCWLWKFQIGVFYNLSSLNASIVNTSIVGASGWGVLINSSNSTIISSVNVQNSSKLGLWLNGRTYFASIANSSFNSTGTAIFLASTIGNCTFYNITAQGSSTAIMINGSDFLDFNNINAFSSIFSAIAANSTTSFITFTNLTATSTNGPALNVSAAGSAVITNISIINSSLTSTATNDIYLEVGGSGTGKLGFIFFLNTTFNRSDIIWSGLTPTRIANITVMWSPAVNASAYNLSGISSASLNITPANTSLIFSGLTGADGYISSAPNFTEFFANGSFAYNGANGLNLTFHTPHNVTANKTGYDTNSTNFTINDSTGITLYLRFADDIAPNVSFIAPVNLKNATSSLLINLSINDSGAGVSFVQFRLENASENATPWTNASLGPGSIAIGFWNYALDISAVADGLYNISVNATDFNGNANKTVNVSIMIDNTAPVLAAVSPVNGTTYATGQALLINFSINDSTTGVTNATWRIEKNGANFTAWKDLSMGEGTIYAGHWNATYDTSALTAGTYNVTVNASDFAVPDPSATASSSFIIQAQGGGGGSQQQSPSYYYDPNAKPVLCEPPYCTITPAENEQQQKPAEEGQKPAEPPSEKPPSETPITPEQPGELAPQEQPQPPVTEQISNKMQELKADLDVAVIELELKLKGGQFGPDAQAKFAEAKQAIANGDYVQAQILLAQVRDLMNASPSGQQNLFGLPLWAWSAGAVAVLAGAIYFVKFRRRY